PAATPADIVAALHRESAKILAQPDMKERLATLGYDVVASTPEEFATRIKTEIDMWAKVIRAANIKAEKGRPVDHLVGALHANDWPRFRRATAPPSRWF